MSNSRLNVPLQLNFHVAQYVHCPNGTVASIHATTTVETFVDMERPRQIHISIRTLLVSRSRRLLLQFRLFYAARCCPRILLRLLNPLSNLSVARSFRNSRSNLNPGKPFCQLCPRKLIDQTTYQLLLFIVSESNLPATK